MDDRSWRSPVLALGQIDAWFTEYDKKRFIFYQLDPIHGEGREVLKIPNPGKPDELAGYFQPLAFPTTCQITPDGSFIACARDKDPVVFRFLPLGGGQERDVTIKGVLCLGHQFDLSPDGKGVYTNGSTAHSESRSALYIGLGGDVHELRPSTGDVNINIVRVSPDGRHLAFDADVEAKNVWLIENF